MNYERTRLMAYYNLEQSKAFESLPELEPKYDSLPDNLQLDTATVAIVKRWMIGDIKNLFSSIDIEKVISKYEQYGKVIKKLGLTVVTAADAVQISNACSVSGYEEMINVLNPELDAIPLRRKMLLEKAEVFSKDRRGLYFTNFTFIDSSERLLRQDRKKIMGLFNLTGSKSMTPHISIFATHDYDVALHLKDTLNNYIRTPRGIILGPPKFLECRNV